MKKMTCYELGGACDKEFYGNSFKELAKKSKAHALEMLQQGDQDHLKAMQEMKEFMDTPQKMEQWMNEKEAWFNDLEELD